MANTRKSTKRAKQALSRTSRNQTIRSGTKTVLKKAIEAMKTKDLGKAKEAYMAAVKTLAKAASKGALPKGRAARKISRLTLLAKKSLPAVFSASAKK